VEFVPEIGIEGEVNQERSIHVPRIGPC